MNNKIIIYTDGACKGDGTGGWGAHLSFKDKVKEIYGGETDSTNNRMEIMSVIKALQCLTKPNCNLVLHSDSMYVINGCKTWRHNWKRSGWTKKGGLKNKELWIELDSEIEKHVIEWVWVKGHNGDVGNERADELANMGVVQVRGF